MIVRLWITISLQVSEHISLTAFASGEIICRNNLWICVYVYLWIKGFVCSKSRDYSFVGSNNEHNYTLISCSLKALRLLAKSITCHMFIRINTTVKFWNFDGRNQDGGTTEGCWEWRGCWTALPPVLWNIGVKSPLEDPKITNFMHY